MNDDEDEIDIQTPGFRFRARAGALRVWTLGWIATVGLITLGVVVWTRAPSETPIADRNGWSADAFRNEETQQFVGSLPTFEIVGDDGQPISQDNRNANVRLWDAVVAVNGRNLDNIPQQVGDCVSWAYCHAGEIVICVEKAAGAAGEFHRLFPPYIYGTSRVQIGGKRLRGDGSCMAWAVKAGQEFGVLRMDADGVPPYSGSIARQWGSQGPPRDLIEATKMYTIGTASPVRTAHEVRDAIVNGYPVPFGAGGIGFDRVVVKYGRLVGDPPQGSWAHAQCCIGYDGSGAEPLYAILNSWGPLAGGHSPTDGSPPGSYWITERSMDRIARQGDAFAISGFAGFKARKIDFKLTKTPEPQRASPGFFAAQTTNRGLAPVGSLTRKESRHAIVDLAL